MIAVVEIGGKQYKVTPNSKLQVDLLEKEVGDELVIDQVLLKSDDEGKDCNIGTPYTGDSITAKVVEHTKGDKIRVFKFTPKKRHQKTIGHRQNYTIIEISDF